jgi:His-Xaa-Ser system protein HxsD
VALPGIETDALGDYARVQIDRELYSDQTVFKTAYWFTDRFYVFLESSPDNHITVELRPKVSSQPANLLMVCGEFSNSLVDFRVRGMVLSETSTIRDALVTKAFMEGIPKPRVEGDQAPSGSS